MGHLSLVCLPMALNGKESERNFFIPKDPPNKHNRGCQKVGVPWAQLVRRDSDCNLTLETVGLGFDSLE